MLMTRLLGFTNSAINPLIYYFMSEKFRRSFRSILFACCFCCRHDRRSAAAAAASVRNQRMYSPANFLDYKQKPRDHRGSLSQTKPADSKIGGRSIGKSTGYTKSCGGDKTWLANTSQHRDTPSGKQTTTQAYPKTNTHKRRLSPNSTTSLLSANHTNASVHDADVITATSATAALNESVRRQEKPDNDIKHITMTLHIITTQRDDDVESYSDGAADHLESITAQQQEQPELSRDASVEDEPMLDASVAVC